MNATLLRFFCFLSIFSCFFITNLAQTDVFKDLQAYDIQFYYTDFEEIKNLNYKQNGIGYYIELDNNKDFLLKSNYDGFCFKTKLNLKEIQKILNFSIKNTQKLEKSEVFYVFSSIFQKFNKKTNLDFNLEIVVFEDYILIGYPLLLGSY